MSLPHMGHVMIINNLAAEIPDTVGDVETLVFTLTKIGFKVKQYKNISYQVTDLRVLTETCIKCFLNADTFCRFCRMR